MIFPACFIYDKYMSKRIKRGKIRTRQKTQRILVKNFDSKFINIIHEFLNVS